MNLISKKVRVFGVPGFEVIDYNDWAAQCRHEFTAGLLKRVSYEGMQVRAMTPGRVMFKTKETAGRWPAAGGARADYLAGGIRASGTGALTHAAWLAPIAIA